MWCFIGSPPAFVITGASLGSPASALYEPFVITGTLLRSPPSAHYNPFVLTDASLGSPPQLSTNHSLIQVFHLEVHRSYRCFTSKSTIVLGTSLGSTPPRLSMSHIRNCRRKSLYGKCFVQKHSTSEGLSTWHSPSGAFMAFQESFVKIERTQHSIVAYLICLIERIELPRALSQDAKHS